MASFVTAPVPTEFNREIVPSYDRLVTTMARRGSLNQWRDVERCPLELLLRKLLEKHKSIACTIFHTLVFQFSVGAQLLICSTKMLLIDQLN